MTKDYIGEPAKWTDLEEDMWMRIQKDSQHVDPLVYDHMRDYVIFENHQPLLTKIGESLRNIYLENK